MNTTDTEQSKYKRGTNSSTYATLSFLTSDTRDIVIPWQKTLRIYHFLVARESDFKRGPNTYIFPFWTFFRLSKAQVWTGATLMKETEISDQTLGPCWDLWMYWRHFYYTWCGYTIYQLPNRPQNIGTSLKKNIIILLGYLEITFNTKSMIMTLLVMTSWRLLTTTSQNSAFYTTIFIRLHMAGIINPRITSTTSSPKPYSLVEKFKRSIKHALTLLPLFIYQTVKNNWNHNAIATDWT